MYADHSGPLHKTLQVGKFDGHKGGKNKLACTTEAEEAFDQLEERLLGQLGLFLMDPDRGLCFARKPRTMPRGQSFSRSGATEHMS